MRQQVRKEGVLSEMDGVATRIRIKYFLNQVILIFRIFLIEPFHMMRLGKWYRTLLAERLGFYAHSTTKRALWLHAPSKAEMRLLATVARSLPKQIPLVVTSWHRRHLEIAKRGLEDRDVVTLPPPFPLGFSIRAFIRHFDPHALVILEGLDLFPLHLLFIGKRHLPCSIINSLFLERNREYWRRQAPFLSLLDSVTTQTKEDYDAFVQIGLPPEILTVAGDLRFELSPPKPIGELTSQLEQVASGRPIFIGASIESKAELDSILKAFQSIGGGERAMLIIAPGSRQQFNEVASLLSDVGLDYVRRTSLPASGRPDVVLLDSIGELASLYTMASGAFIGGTLSPSGNGHGPLEAACCGVPLVLGPSMKNFRNIERKFESAKAWCRIETGEELTEVWSSWLDDPEAAREIGKRGRSVVSENRGALKRTLEVLEPMIRLLSVER